MRSLLYGFVAHAGRRGGDRGVLVVGAAGCRCPSSIPWRRLCWVAVLAYLTPAGPPCALIRWRCGCGRATANEAADLGIRLCQSAARRCTAATCCVAIPDRAVALALVRDRRLAADPRDVVAEAVARSHHAVRAVARRVRPADDARRPVARAVRRCGGGQLLSDADLRRLSPWRSFTQPVYQLEGGCFLAGAPAHRADPPRARARRS